MLLKVRVMRMRAATEASFLADVLTLAKLHGWRTIHVRPAWTKKGWKTPLQGDGEGFPDLLMLKGMKIIAAELKGPRGSVSHEQRAWLMAFREAGVISYLWRPKDWKRIEEILSQ